jgi:hypothetical protein
MRVEVVTKWKNNLFPRELPSTAGDAYTVPISQSHFVVRRNNLRVDHLIVYQVAGILSIRYRVIGSTRDERTVDFTLKQHK